MSKEKIISSLDNLIFACLVIYSLTFITNINTKFLFFAFYICILKLFFIKPKINLSTKHIHFIILFITCLFISLISNNLLQLDNITEYKSDVLNPLIGLIIFFIYKITYKKFLILLSTFSISLSINALIILYHSYLGEVGRPVGLCDFHYMFLAGVNLLIIPFILTYSLNKTTYYNNNADIITFNYYDYYNKDKISPHLLFNNLKFYAQQEFHSTFAKDLFNKYEMNVTAWNKVYKRKIFNNIKFPYGKLFEDTFSAIYILNQCNNILVIPDTLYYYRRRNDSIIGKHIQEKKYNIINIDSIEAKIMSAVDFYIFANHNKESTEMLFRILKNSLDDILFSANRNQYKNYELALIYLLKNLYKKPQLSLKIKFGILKRCFNIELYRRLIILFKK